MGQKEGVGRLILASGQKSWRKTTSFLRGSSGYIGHSCAHFGVSEFSECERRFGWIFTESNYLQEKYRRPPGFCYQPFLKWKQHPVLQRTSIETMPNSDILLPILTLSLTPGSAQTHNRPWMTHTGWQSKPLIVISKLWQRWKYVRSRSVFTHLLHHTNTPFLSLCNFKQQHKKTAAGKLQNSVDMDDFSITHLVPWSRLRAQLDFRYIRFILKFFIFIFQMLFFNF